jgi:hypothetical protein
METMIRDALVLRSIPLVTSGLAFLPACGDGGGTVTGDDDDTGSDPTTQTASDDDSSSGSADDSNDTSSGDEMPTTDPDSSSGGGSSDDGTGVCGDGMCSAIPPVGWFGPVTYAAVPPGSPPPECPADVLQAGPTVLRGFVDPGPAVCGCECELSAPLSCSTCATEVAQATQCGNYYGCYGGGSVMVTESCTNVDFDGIIRFTSQDNYYYGGGGNPTCDETEIEDIPPFQWEATISTCRVPYDALVCDEGICVPPLPEGFENKWCMYQTGDLECPAGPFANKELFYSNVEDTRACSNCQCGTSGTTCDTVELMAFTGADCAGDPIATMTAATDCVDLVVGSVAGNFFTDGGCPVTEPSMPQGAIMPTGPYTFCCAD